jgi:hypothetical protein
VGEMELASGAGELLKLPTSPSSMSPYSYLPNDATVGRQPGMAYARAASAFRGKTDRSINPLCRPTIWNCCRSSGQRMFPALRHVICW